MIVLAVRGLKFRHAREVVIAMVAVCSCGVGLGELVQQRTAGVDPDHGRFTSSWLRCRAEVVRGGGDVDDRGMRDVRALVGG